MPGKTLYKNHKKAKTSRVLGSVRELSDKWGLTEQLQKGEVLGPPFREVLECAVEISKRAKILAGTANSQERRIVLNVALLEIGRENDRNVTFMHECAHILTDLFYGRSCKHNQSWRDIMRLLGQNPIVSHNLSYLSRSSQAVVAWQCNNCIKKYYFVRKPRRNPSKCFCQSCGPELGHLKVTCFL